MPLTKYTETHEWLELIARASSLAAVGQEMWAFSQTEWLSAIGTLPERNPFLVFREKYKSGLGGVAGHDHSRATAGYRLIFLRMATVKLTLITW